MSLDQAFRDIQAEPSAGASHASRLPVAIEDVRELAGRNSRPGIAYREPREAVLEIGFERDRAAWRRKLDRISDQVGKHLEHAVRVRGYPRITSGPPEPDLLGLGERRQHRDRLRHHDLDGQRRLVDLEAAGFDLGEIEKVANQSIHAVDRAANPLDHLRAARVVG